MRKTVKEWSELKKDLVFLGFTEDAAGNYTAVDTTLDFTYCFCYKMRDLCGQTIEVEEERESDKGNYKHKGLYLLAWYFNDCKIEY